MLAFPGNWAIREEAKKKKKKKEANPAALGAASWWQQQEHRLLSQTDLNANSCSVTNCVILDSFLTLSILSLLICKTRWIIPTIPYDCWHWHIEETLMHTSAGQKKKRQEKEDTNLLRKGENLSLVNSSKLGIYFQILFIQGLWKETHEHKLQLYFLCMGLRNEKLLKTTKIFRR